MEKKKKYPVWKGNKYGDHGAVNFFINYAPSIDSVGFWDIPEGCGYGEGLYFDIKHIDKVIKILKKIKKRHESKDE